MPYKCRLPAILKYGPVLHMNGSYRGLDSIQQRPPFTIPFTTQRPSSSPAAPRAPLPVTSLRLFCFTDEGISPPSPSASPPSPSLSAFAARSSCSVSPGRTLARPQDKFHTCTKPLASPQARNERMRGLKATVWTAPGGLACCGCFISATAELVETSKSKRYTEPFAPAAANTIGLVCDHAALWRQHAAGSSTSRGLLWSKE
mmetsp:Transcript_11877/g.27570  ORF Transcript_11877/g.27570 Transcript_11877/m.27570 type:complete len:202 (-) Transcript_11877:1423-2028(-)